MIPEPTDLADDDRPVNIDALTPRDRNRLGRLALRYRVRRDTTLRPLADVMFDLRLRHRINLSMGQVLELVGQRMKP